MLKSDISFDEYLKIDAFSRSEILNIARSHKYYLYKKSCENKLDESDSLKFGRLVHTLVLEPQSINDRYYLTNKIVKRGDTWNSLKKEAGMKEIVFHEDCEKAEKIKQAILTNKIVAEKKLLENIEAEVTAKWIYAEFGKISCMFKCRIDALKITEKSNIIIDLKTTTDCSEEHFSKDMAAYKYHLQAAFYIDGFEAVTNKKCTRFLFIVVEKEPPFLNKIYSLHPDSEEIKTGRAEYKAIIDDFLPKLRANDFDEDTVTPIKLPYWYGFKK